MDKSLDRFLEGQLKKEATPEHIAEEMVALIPDEIIQNLDSKYLDINCKTGVFPIKIRDRLMRENKKLIEMFPAGQERERRKYIDEHCKIFGISWIKEYTNRSRANIYGKATIKGKIHYVPEVKNKNGKLEPAYKTLIAAKDNGKLLNDTIKEICDMQFETDMSFDVVIGNPPYNDGMDIDFVFKAFQLATKYVAMITPAKCFTAEATQKISSKYSYEDFRRELVPHMNQVCFYPNCSDVFDIQERSGIVYYTLVKDICDKCNVKNMSLYQSIFNSTEYRDIKNGESLLNIVDEIISYLGDYKSFRFSNYTGKYGVNIGKCIRNERGKKDMYQALGVISYNSGKASVLENSEIVENVGGDFITSILNSEIIFLSNDIKECESFESWLATKFVRLFIFGNISTRSNVFNNHYFRFVPAPPSDKFDHIYTDEELYEAFGLNKPEAQTKDGVRYRDIIEAVIKERK